MAWSRREPANRQYKLELAKFCNNDAETARVVRRLRPRAARRNDQALALLDDLLRPAPSLGIEHADAHNLRGRILASAGSPEAESAFRESLQLFDELDHNPAARLLAAFHERFSDLLLNLAALVTAADPPPPAACSPTPSRITSRTRTQAPPPAIAADAQLALDNLSQLLAELRDREKPSCSSPYRQLEQRLQSGAR